ncbi:MAG TPA: hypothetical protein VGL73_05750 [Caulobacteraceae bacterium]
MKTHLAALAAGLALALAAAAAVAQDFPREGVKGAELNAAFRPKGITFEAPADQPVVMMDSRDVYGGDALAGARGDTVLLQQGGHPCQYAMVFDRPAVNFAFNRSRLVAGPSGVTHPVWTATAMDAEGRALGSVGEAEIRSYSDVPAQRFTLTGPGITRIVFWGDDKGIDGFCNVVTDTADVTY